jgi:hypothetical protein
MSPSVAFSSSLALALVGLVFVTISLVRTGRFKAATTPTDDVAALRAHRRWMIIGIVSLVVLLAATALFFYVWFRCAGEC